MSRGGDLSRPSRGKAASDAEKGLPLDVRSRLKLVVGTYGGAKKLSDAVGIPVTTLHAALRGANDPRASMMAAIAKKAECSLDWLMYGENAAAIVRPGFADGDGAQPDIPRLSLDRADPLFARAPVLEGGDALPLIDALCRLLQLSDVSPLRVLLMTMQNDASLPLLAAGDVILVDCAARELRDGSTVVIDFNGELVVKRVERIFDGSILLKPSNPAYEHQHVPSGDVGGLKVVGRARGVIRRL